jgi:hypothetical protein
MDQLISTEPSNVDGSDVPIVLDGQGTLNREQVISSMAEIA